MVKTKKIYPLEECCNLILNSLNHHHKQWMANGKGKCMICTRF